MKIYNWAIIVPIAYDMYERAEDYAVAKRTLNECTDKGGIQLKSVQPIENGNKNSYVSTKIYKCRDQIPAIIKWAIPKNFTSLTEVCTSTFPKRVYHYTVPAFSSFEMKLESNAKPFKYGDNIELENLCYIDIVNWDPVAKARDQRMDGFECKEAGIHKLPNLTKNNKHEIPEWVKTYKGPMTVITKTYTISVKIFGIGGKVENLLGQSVMPNVVAETNRMMISWAPEWYKLSAQNVKKYEMKTYKEVNDRLERNNCH